MNSDTRNTLTVESLFDGSAPQEIRGMLFLHVAIVEKAISDLSCSNEFARRTARRWISDASPDVRGFGWICQLFGVNAEKAKKEILAQYH